MMSVEKCNQEMMSVESKKKKKVFDISEHEWDSEMCLILSPKTLSPIQLNCHSKKK